MLQKVWLRDWQSRQLLRTGCLFFVQKEGSKSLNHCFESKGIHYKDVAAYTTRVDWRKQDLLLRAIKTRII